MSTQLAPLSASVTRILCLTGFPKELKTKDIQAAFSDWENAMGGFRIKWIDDTSLMIVFADAGVAKRAYLQTLASPPPSIFGIDSAAVIRPYDGPEAQAIIQNVNSRHHTNASRGHISRGSVSGGLHNRMASTSQRNGHKLINGSIPEHPSITTNGSGGNISNGREPSPTLPSLPSHPSLNAMIQQSTSTFAEDAVLNDPAILAMSADVSSGTGPRIGDPGRRMLGAALGVRHPGLGPRNVSGSNTGAALGGGADPTLMKEMQKAMGGLVVSE